MHDVGVRGEGQMYPTSTTSEFLSTDKVDAQRKPGPAEYGWFCTWLEKRRHKKRSSRLEWPNAEIRRERGPTCGPMVHPAVLIDRIENGWPKPSKWAAVWGWFRVQWKTPTFVASYIWVRRTLVHS